MWLVSSIWFVALLVSGWRMYSKAGQPGWVGIVPILSTLGALKMIGKPYWWAVLYFVPVLNVIVYTVVEILVARSFGQSALFGIGLAVPITRPFFKLMLGFGSARYLGPTT